jgi:choline dehydrogenase
VYANSEVVLSAGSINSPKLLMLSGVGPADHLATVGIRTVENLPRVGQNLSDHVDVGLKYCTRPISNSPLLRPHRKVLIGLEWILFKTGPAATNHFEVAGYIRTRPDLSRPNIDVCFIPMLVHYDGSAASTEHGFQIALMGLQPKSRGRVTLANADPRTPPILQFNYLSEDADVATLREGLEAMRDIIRQKSLNPYRGAELAPGDQVTSRQDLEGYIRETAKSTHHPCSSCRMGSDENAVVDSEGRVRGMDRLRIIDASIMPSITSGSLNAPTIMIAEKLADKVRGRPAEPAADLAPDVGSGRRVSKGDADQSGPTVTNLFQFS